MVDNLLKEGDVVELRPGHTVYADIPQHFVYGNRRGVFSKTAHTEVTIGKSMDGFSTDYLIGKWVVVHACEDGGGTGHGPDDVYPSGHHVIVQKLDNDNLRVDFYQTGCFTAMISDLPVVGHATATYHLESEENDG